MTRLEAAGYLVVAAVALGVSAITDEIDEMRMRTQLLRDNMRGRLTGDGSNVGDGERVTGEGGSALD